MGPCYRGPMDRIAATLVYEAPAWQSWSKIHGLCQWKVRFVEVCGRDLLYYRPFGEEGLSSIIFDWCEANIPAHHPCYISEDDTVSFRFREDAQLCYLAFAAR